MNVKELAAPVLAAIGLIGLIVLLALSKDVSVLLPIESALIGFAVGANKELVSSLVRGKK